MFKRILNETIDYVCYKYKPQLTDLIRETQSKLKDLDFEIGRRYYKMKVSKEKKWKAGIETNNKHICIGRFYTEKEAAIAYNKKAVELFGEYAKINKIKD